MHTGLAYVGTTGPEGAVTDFTALGDAVNTTARLASAASAGELLVSIEAATAAELKVSGLPTRNVTVRGTVATDRRPVAHGLGAERTLIWAVEVLVDTEVVP